MATAGGTLKWQQETYSASTTACNLVAARDSRPEELRSYKYICAAVALPPSILGLGDGPGY
jgi:hypothetical protein